MAVLVLCAMALGLTGCGSGDPEPARAHQGESFRIGVAERPDSLNPFTAADRVSEEFFLLVYDPLWRLNAAGEPVNCLVEDWSMSSDQLTWTIRLRRDVTFSNGTPLTSRDVKFSYEELDRYDTVYADYFEGITAITCPDDYTVVISTSFVKGDMLYAPVPILPRSIWSDYSSAGYDTFDNEQMIGSGPFTRLLADTGPQEESWTFQARENYFGGSPQVGEVRFVYYATEANAGRALSIGDVDAAVGLSDVQLTTLEGVPGVQIIQTYLPGSQIWALAFNTRDSVFSDTSLRQMVDYCVDRDRILSMSSGTSGMAGSVWASPGTDYFHQVYAPRSFNQETSRSVLYSKGYSDVDQDGYLEFVGSYEDLVLRLYTSTHDDWSSTAATVLIEDLGELGVQVTWNTTDGDVTNVCGPKDDWDMCLLSMRGNTDPVIAGMPFRTADRGLTGWSNSTYDQTFAQMQTSMDRAAVVGLAGQLQQLVYDESPVLILGYYSDIQALRTDRWEGFDEVLAAAGGLFGIGSVDAYMAIRPVESEAS